MKTKTVISLGSVEKVLKDYVDEISHLTDMALQEAVEKTSKDSKKHIRDYTKSHLIKSSYNRGLYVKSFKTNKLTSISQRLSDKEYRLDHLLEHGHKSRNQFGGPYVVGEKRDKKGNVINRPRLKYEKFNRPKTHKFHMWQNVQDFIDKELPKNVKNEIDKL